jgi:protein-L-isoaspartate(D-aspartate) O-methyltransferase
MGVVERDGPVGKACLYVAAHDGLGRRELFDCFAPFLAGFEPKHAFAL